MIHNNVRPLFLLIILPRDDDFYEKAPYRSIPGRGDFLCVDHLRHKFRIDFPDYVFRLGVPDLVLVSRVPERIQEKQSLVAGKVYIHQAFLKSFTASAILLHSILPGSIHTLASPTYITCW